MADPIGEILKQMDLISDAEIEEIVKLQEDKPGKKFGELAVEAGYITPPDLMYAIATQTGMPVEDLDEREEINPDVINRVPKQMAETYRIMPVEFEDNVLVVALADPMNTNVLDDIRFMTNCEVKGAVALPESIDRAFEKYYGGKEDNLATAMAELGINPDDVKSVEEGKENSQKDLEAMAESTPVVKLLNLILLQAIKDRAADIHLEPFENDFKVRQRIDGVLYEMKPPPPPHLASAMTSRVKVMSGLDISERRLPQDGRIELNVGGKPVDIRVSTLPTMFGESVVMRILDRSNVDLDLNNLGIRAKDLEIIKALIKKPNGVCLVTGPMGLGKTTTLYSCLSEINTIDMKIITCEDPVEYDLPGIIQCMIDPTAEAAEKAAREEGKKEVELKGPTYATALRAMLRQDPDVIFVGEIRDIVTGGIAVEAALTGHLVLSTLHTNDAPSVVTRLTDLGVEPFLLSATLEGVIAQRLVRKICGECKVEYQPSPEELMELNLKPDKVQGRSFFYGEGCKKCNNTGYKGRNAVFEILLSSEQIKKLISEKASLADLRRQARKEGMRTLRESGILAIFDGVTTIEEVVKETVFT
ncbi:MAG TPA: ATPase, T2SS/T4P/T4SS family [Planctomycetota bacterium]|nr:ATPase, T2SS/T4P/T4SS family [Planctomycetota bacterium]